MNPTGSTPRSKITERGSGSVDLLLFFVLLTLGLGDLLLVDGLLVPRYLAAAGSEAVASSSLSPASRPAPAGLPSTRAERLVVNSESTPDAASDPGDGQELPVKVLPLQDDATEEKPARAAPASGKATTRVAGELKDDEPLPYFPHIRYDPGSSSIPRAGKKLLRQAARTLRKRRSVTVLLYGHADRTSERKHGPLSQQRAIRVAKYLLAMGVAQDRITTKGFGATRPLDRSDTALARNRNRRVEVQFK